MHNFSLSSRAIHSLSPVTNEPIFVFRKLETNILSDSIPEVLLSTFILLILSLNEFSRSVYKTTDLFGMFVRKAGRISRCKKTLFGFIMVNL